MLTVKSKNPSKSIFLYRLINTYNKWNKKISKKTNSESRLYKTKAQAPN